MRICTTSRRRPSAIQFGAPVCFRGLALLRGEGRLQIRFGASVCSRGSALRLEEAVCNTDWHISVLPRICATSWRSPPAIRFGASVQGRRLQLQGADLLGPGSLTKTELGARERAPRKEGDHRQRFQDGLTSSPRGDRARFTDSPACGFGKELIMIVPFSFWDPLGQFKDGELHFKTLTSSDPA
jgi:hypothetical protein